MKTRSSIFNPCWFVIGVCFFGACSSERQIERTADRADSLFKNGDFEEAKIEYMNLLRLDPEDGRAMGNLGIIWHEEGAPLRALPFLFRSRQLEPDNLAARMKLALAFSNVGQVSEGRKEAEEILDRAPRHGEALLFLAGKASTVEEIGKVEARLEAVGDEVNAATELARAAILLRQKDKEGAEKAVQRALELNPESPTAHSAMGRIYAARGEKDAAQRELQKAAELAPPRSPERLRHVRFLVGVGELEKAKLVLAELTDRVPDFLTAWKFRAQLALAEKDYDGALKMLENVFSRDATNFEARLLEANTLLAKEEVSKALKVLENLESAYPQSPFIQMQIARIHMARSDWKEAEKSAAKAVVLNPNFAEAILLSARFDLKRGDAKKVIETMKEFVRKYPENAEAQNLLARAYTAAGQLENAARIYRAQINDDAQNARPQVLLGAILRRQERDDEARERFETAQGLMPNNLLVTDQLVELDIKEGKHAAALDRLKVHRERNPELPGVHFLEGKIHAARKDWEPAEAALKKTLELKEDFAGAYDLLISLYLATNRLSEAATELERVLEINPRNVRALMLSAMIYAVLGEPAKVEACYKKVLAENPNFVAALNNLAYLYAEKPDRLEEAHDLAVRARALNPEDAALADTLGWILYKKGDYQQALSLLRESVLKLPGNPEIQYHLGMTAYKMGRTEEAQAALEKAVAAELKFRGKEEARDQLAFLKGSADGGEELAAETLEEMLLRRPEDHILRMRLGEAYEREGRHEEAAGAYEEVIKVNAQMSDAIKGLARLYGGPLDDREKALRFAKEARRIEPSDARVAAMLGKLACEGGDFAWGYSLLKESVEKISGDPGIMTDYAWAAYSQSKVKEAADVMRRLPEEAPGTSWAAEADRFLEFTSFLIDGKEDLASIEGAADAALKNDPTYVPALMVKGAAETGRGDETAAVTFYGKVLDRYPGFAPAQKSLAALYAKDPGKLKEASELASAARKTLRGDAELARTLAEISFKKGEYAYALQLLNESAEKQPLDAEGHFYAGISHLRMDDGTKGEAALKQAIESGLEEPLLGQAREALSGPKGGGE